MSNTKKVGRRNIGEKILELRRKGKSYNEISAKLNCSKGTITYHAKKVGLNEPIGYEKNHKRLSKKEQNKIFNYTKNNPDNIAQAIRALGHCRATIEKYGCFQNQD